jgi:hypothetical protein
MTCRVTVPLWFLAIGFVGMWSPVPAVPTACLLLAVAVIVPTTVVLASPRRYFQSVFTTAHTRR